MTAPKPPPWKEEWKAIDSEGWYEVSNHGRVRSWRNPAKLRRKDPKIIRPEKNNEGYLSISVWMNGKRKQYLIHRLVLSRFVREAAPCEVCNHKDFDPKNNHIRNLEWVTQRENVANSKRSGRIARGERKPSAKLTEEEVREIRKSYRPPLCVASDLAIKFGVASRTIQDIVYRKRWKHVD